MNSMRILLVDDDVNILSIYSKILIEEGHEVSTAENGYDAILLAEKEEFECIITDVYMPRIGGVDLITQIKQLNGNAYIIVISGRSNIKTAVSVMKKGVYSFIEKPIDVEVLLMEINKIAESLFQKNQSAYLRKTINQNYGKIIGQTPAINRIISFLPTVARSNSNVLISGESGTGKEVLANQIHRLSNRSENAMVKINCAAFNENILESELFGHEKGAFTGAYKTKKGLFELADNSTLFLDEIGEMSIQMQAKLLRVLQDKSFMRVGGNKEIVSNFRLISASNKNLSEAINNKVFRSDLFYRLNVIPIKIPPLRERIDDIELLINHFIKQYSFEMSKPTLRLDKAVITKFKEYSWPGNIRELKNIIERMMVLSDDGVVNTEEIELFSNSKISSDYELVNDLEEAKMQFERFFLEKKLTQFNWNITKMADIINTSRKNIYQKIKKYGIEKPHDTTATK